MRKLPGSLLLFISLPFFFAMTCQSVTKNTNLDELNKVIEMEKGPCYGNCPVFTLTVYDNGIVSYRGERFTERRGLYRLDIGRKGAEDLKQAFAAANLWQYPDAFKAQIPDLPTITLTYYEGDRTKTIRGKDGRPESVLKLEQMLDEITARQGWKQIEAADTGLPEGFIANELIVQLDPGIKGEIWVRLYAKQEMKTVKQLAANGNYWLVSFNTDIIPPQEMLRWVRQDPDVLGAEFNKQLEMRN